MILTKIRYKCNSCNKESFHINAVKHNRELISSFPKENIETFDEAESFNSIYLWETKRDEEGILLGNFGVRLKCDSCNSIDLRRIQEDSSDDVLNFYPPSEAGKWFNGFQKHS